jgi:hypothetical protein
MITSGSTALMPGSCLSRSICQTSMWQMTASGRFI